jgi:5-methylcytosine-specific restriction enzyme A
MSLLKEITPTIRQRVIDLVEAAGVDVSDWANFKGEDAGKNPKYCYEWAFVEPGKVAVLNLWLDLMREEEGNIIYRLNTREDAKGFALARSSVQGRRALRMDEVLQRALQELLMVRVIICSGNRRKIEEKKPSHVGKRLLDTCPWSIAAYDFDTGDCVLTRGVAAGRIVDQSSLHQPAGTPARKRTVLGTAYIRSLEVRRRVLHRSNGKCEFCDAPGFLLPDGSIFVETHHVIPLFRGGVDSEANVVALCPNHHREAHYGQMRDEIRKTLQARLAKTH